jgi:hypothetical protein
MGLENAGVLPQSFRFGVSRQRRESWIHVLDVAGGVGNGNAVRRLFHSCHQARAFD